ncbi:MAG: Eco57I restriction-modification methylase domain-containing protein [Anaerolineaceae bacterium]|nr:Eco57I restriction-modification methylase domain-containing protein [Anaerolineaceae bacterium]
MAEQFRQTIQSLLEKLPSRKIDALKQLFWTELNYEQVNQGLPIREWPAILQDLIVGAPLLFAAAGENRGFHVVYCRLKSQKLPFDDERRLIAKLLIDHPHSLYIFSDQDQTNWHFVNTKFGRDDESTAKRVLRRITVGPSEGLRTATERLSLIDIASLSTDFVGISPLVIQHHHNEAFDVEAVTRDFFNKYRDVFQKIEASLPLSEEITTEKRRLFVQRFFNRLMFLMFLERKGWLSFNGNKKYLGALMLDYGQNEKDKLGGYGFHRSRLNLLFFNTLNNKDGRNRIKDPKFRVLCEKAGEAPFLNGGLFKEEEGDHVWFFPDSLIVSILTDLLYAFNFTITESTPLDVEVAVDPEMLGKIFEELVTGRHETGSYYTPKPVVSFMCRQALKGYLRDRCPEETENALDSYVEKRNPVGLVNPEKVLTALHEVRVCDPACGSGAYLLGMLHELLDLREALFVVHQIDDKKIYERKLEVIQNNLFGVDKDPFAVNIAKLRLWLSLVVDDSRSPLEQVDLDVALPNLDFKIEPGDSLTAPDPTGGLSNLSVDIVKQYQIAKNIYGFSHGLQQHAHYQKVIDLHTNIQAWAGRRSGTNEFDWRVEFAEIFTPNEQHKGGFDIVLANPPFVRADAQFKHIKVESERRKEITEWKAYRNQLISAKIFKTLYEKWDLYIVFLERAYQLLGYGGQMVFIIPDAYNAAKYAKKSQEFFMENTSVERIDFCSEIDLFDAGVNNTILHFSKRTVTDTHSPIRMKHWGNRDQFEENCQNVLTQYQIEYGSELFKQDATQNIGENQNSIPLNNICYISYGLRANADERHWRGDFVTDDLIENTKDATHPKPFVEGKDITRWYVKRIRYLEWGTERAPKKFARPTFLDLHEARPKLISLVVSSDGPPVVLDDEKLFTTHTSCIFVPWYLLEGIINKSINKTTKYRTQDPMGNRVEREQISRGFNLKYVLAVMNSSFTRNWLKAKRRSKIHVYPDDWKQLPIASIPMDEQMDFVKLVDKILGEWKQYGYPLPQIPAKHVAELERQLDEMVAKLYE